MRPSLQPIGGELDDHATLRRGVGGTPPELSIVNAAVGAVDHDILAVGDLIYETDADDASDHGHLAVAALEHQHHAGLTLDSGRVQGTLHHLELVHAIAELAQLRLELGIERPDTGLPLFCQPQTLERLETPHTHRMTAWFLLVGG